jgi:hypothetical protein
VTMITASIALCLGDALNLSYGHRLALNLQSFAVCRHLHRKCAGHSQTLVVLAGVVECSTPSALSRISLLFFFDSMVLWRDPGRLLLEPRLSSGSLYLQQPRPLSTATASTFEH